MERLAKAKAIRLRSHKGSYVVAHDDKETVGVGESNGGSSPNAKWLVERVQGNPNVIRLKSCFGLYLTATDGKVDWELICDDVVQMKLKSWGHKLLQSDGAAQNRTFNFMRWVGELLQGCCQPNTVSPHDPNSGATQNWVFWHVVVEDLPDGTVAYNPFSSALKDLLGSELNFQLANNILVPPRAPVASPLQGRNVTARRALHRGGGRRGCAVASNAFGQANGQIGLDAEEASASEDSNDFGQTQGWNKIVLKVFHRTP